MVRFALRPHFRGGFRSIFVFFPHPPKKPRYGFPNSEENARGIPCRVLSVCNFPFWGRVNFGGFFYRPPGLGGFFSGHPVVGTTWN